MDRFDEQLLLALIEDELSPEDADELRRRLEARPDLRAELDAMRSDRLMLRSEPEPAMPGDFLEQVEGRLARPMLLDPAGGDHARRRGIGTPGRFRRRHQPRRGWRIAARLTLAASLLLLVAGGAGLIAIGTGALDRDQFWSFGRSPAESETTGDSRRAAPGATSTESAPFPHGVVHHYGPRGLGDAAFGNDAIGDAAITMQSEQRIDEALPLDFVLVVRAEDVTRAEQRVHDAVLKLSAHNALVQNMSVDEARYLEAQWLVANSAPASPATQATPMQAGSELKSAPGQVAPASDAGMTVATDAAQRAPAEHAADTAPAGSGPGDLTRLAQRAREQMYHMSDPPDGLSDSPPAGTPSHRHGLGHVFSRQLAGPHDRAATIEQQIAFSKRGATHTITIPASQLERLLDELHDDRDLRTELQVLPEPAEMGEAPPAGTRWGGDPVGKARSASSEGVVGAGDVDTRRQGLTRSAESLRELWLSNNAIVRQRFEMLRQQHADQTVYLPIIIEPALQPTVSSEGEPSDAPAGENQDN